ncbi:MAG: XRE family transcriptional regulator [Chitinophagaceae bacterium]|nr:MAG: XRE family transcriptional regulator [Chitinophagaceae bacterium]
MEDRIRKEQVALGKRLKALRKLRNLSQLDIEVATGIPNADISRIENGKTNPELVTLIRLAIALDVPVAEIFNYERDLPESL